MDLYPNHPGLLKEGDMFLADQYEFSCPVKINSGNRALEHLPVELAALNARKPFVVTSPDISKMGGVDVLLNAFRDSGMTVGIFDGVPPVPGLPLIREMYDLHRNGGFDAIIAVGGGPVTDATKALNIAVSGKPADLQHCIGKDRIKTSLKPLIYIPRLSGTGYETSPYAFLGENVYLSHRLMPDLAIIDPRMTVAEDVRSLVGTAMTALTQSVEAYIAPSTNPLVGSYAYTSIQFIMENLLTVVRNPKDKRGCMALANAHCMAGCAFGNAGPGMAHMLGKAVADTCRLPHGRCMSIILPHVLDRQASHAAFHLDDLLMPLAGFEIYAATEKDSRIKKAIEQIRRLQEGVFTATGGIIPRTLKDAGVVDKAALKAISRQVAGDGSQVFDADTCLTILEQAWNSR
jgi:alcohol dehydrogenase